LIVVQDFSLETPKTNALIAKLGEFGLQEALIVTKRSMRICFWLLEICTR